MGDSEKRVREGIDQISDQLCRVVSGDFDLTVSTEVRDESIEKLEMLINFVLDAARRGVTELESRNNETSSRLSAIFDTAVDGIISTNQQGIIESFNRTAARMFGYEPEEVIGKNADILIPPSPQEEKSGSFSFLQIKSIRGSRHEIIGLRKDGSTFPMGLHVSEVPFGDQRIFTGILQDITKEKNAEREMGALSDQLMEASRQAGMAELASGVLHNVGNVLNSVNVSVTLLGDILKKSKIPRVAAVSDMFREHRDDLAAFMTGDEKGQRLPGYLEKLALQLGEEQNEMRGEIDQLSRNIEHIKKIIMTQQSSAHAVGVIESVSLADVANDALTINATSFERYGIQLVREYGDILPVSIDKQKLLQILVNLVRNAKHAVFDRDDEDKLLKIRISKSETDRVRIEVSDNGVGIPRENVERIFEYGFTTKQDGHGFGLHSSALAAKEMGGTLTAVSDGPGTGAAFILDVPVKPPRLGRNASAEGESANG